MLLSADTPTASAAPASSAAASAAAFGASAVHEPTPLLRTHLYHIIHRDCFLSAFKTFAWEKAGSPAPAGDVPPQVLQRHYARKDGVGQTGGAASAKLSRDFDRRPYK